MNRRARRKRKAALPEQGPLNVGKFFAGFGILIILIAAYYAFDTWQERRAAQQDRYNGFDFWQDDFGSWVVRIEIGDQPYTIPFYFHPRETQSVVVDGNATWPLLYHTPQVVYVSVDPDAGSRVVIAGTELSKITGTKYGILNYETHGALSRPLQGKAELPVASCAVATQQRVVLQFVQGPQNRISLQGPYCVRLQYTNASESIRVADQYAYMLLKIA